MDATLVALNFEAESRSTTGDFVVVEAEMESNKRWRSLLCFSSVGDGGVSPFVRRASLTPSFNESILENPLDGEYIDKRKSREMRQRMIRIILQSLNLMSQVDKGSL